MTDGRNREDEPVPIVVTDRRRFTETGEAREAPAPEAAAPPPVQPAAGAARPAPERLAAEPSDLGVQAVFLIFFQSALMALGAPDDLGRRMAPDLDQARESIELLRVLERVTRGNLTQDEETMLKRMLHEAQLAYVQVAGGTGAGGRA